MIFNPVINCNINSELNELLGRCVDSLSITGDWTNIQYTDSDVDYTGLNFTANYNDGTTSVVTPTNISPEVWGSTGGVYTCVFTYEENGYRVNAVKEVKVIDRLPTIPLTLQARNIGNINITKYGDPGIVYYSLNNGPQTELASNTNIPVNIGDKVSLFRTLSNNLDDDNYFTINCTNDCYVYGNVMSLINKDNFTNLDTIEYRYAFSRLFLLNTYIDINESVGKLLLPATTLANYCYGHMFFGCSSLINAPELPAMTLAASCYNYMFYQCTSLTTPPELPATTLTNYCYYSMFARCTSLTTAPELSATTLADLCYFSMFAECTSLTTAPSRLPSTTLVERCYRYMFAKCTSLTTAPELPATTLASNCYNSMFRGCSNLNEITCLATDISATGCTDSWVNGVSSTGTFYKDPSMTDWTISESGIPSGWTVVNK